MNDPKRVPFAEVGKVIAGQHIPSEEYNGDDDGTPYLTGPADFTDRTPVVTKWTNHPRSFAESGDVLLTVKGAGCGKSNLGLDAAIGRQLMALRPNKAKLDRNYLFAFIQSQQERICALGQGATVPGIGKGDIEKLQIPYFPLPEQRRIAAILDKADAIRRKREEGIRLTEELLRSTFLDMFGDPATNERAWPTIFLKEAASRITKGESPKWQGFQYQESGVRFVTSENVLWGKMSIDQPKFIPAAFDEKLRRSHLQEKDVLINLVGASIGRACLVPKCALPGNVNQAVGVITLRQEVMLPDFLLHLLLTPQVQLQLKGGIVESARANISLSTVSSTELICPDLPIQRRWHDVSKHINHDLLNRMNAAKVANHLFDSLVQRAFRGELTNRGSS